MRLALLASFASGKDPMLLRRRQPAVQREHVEIGVAASGQGVGGVPDFAFAAEEDQDVAWPLSPQFGDSVGDGLHLVARFSRRNALLGPGGIRHQRPVADLDGIGAPRHLDDGRSTTVFL